MIYGVDIYYPNNLSGGGMEKSVYQKQTIPSYAKGNRKVQRSISPFVALSVIFNNIFGYMGLSFAGLGMIFVIVFTPMVDFISPFYFGDDAEKTSGIVTEVNSTNVSVNEDNVLEYKFVFTYMGRTYSGVSYSTDRSFTVDQNAPVEFEPDNPAIARIEDMDLKPMPIFVLFVFIFPGIGFVFLYFAFRKGIPKINAIRYGIMTRGKFMKMEATGGSINNQTIYDCHFSFKDRMGNEFTAVGSTHKTELIRDEAEERLFYDPENPANSVVVDAMPSLVRRFLSSIPG